MKPGLLELGSKKGNQLSRISPPLFPPRLDRGDRGDVEVLSEAVLVIRIDRVTFSAKHTAKGKPNPASGQIKQVRSVNIEVQCGELRRKKIPAVQPREINQRRIGRVRDVERIPKRVERSRLPDE